jgi:hypothetical protein
MERQLDTQRRKENKITMKCTLVVFFLPKFVVHRSLKNAMERQQGKRAPANAIDTQGFEDRKNHPLLTTRSSKR